MRVAHIAHPAISQHFSKGEYHLVLAQWLYSHAAYRDYYFASGAIRPPGTEVVLDNGAFEGTRLPDSRLLAASDAVRPDILVLPDVLYECRETLLASREFVGKLSTYEGWKPAKVMFVPQAIEEDTWFHCLETWLAWWNNKRFPFELMVGVTSPRKERLRPDLWEAAYRRKDVLDKITDYVPYDAVHLLGIADVPSFVAHEIRYPVHGVDSSISFVTAWRRQLLTPTTTKVNLDAGGNPTNGEYVLSERLRSLGRINRAALTEWARAGAYVDGYDLATFPPMVDFSPETLSKFLPPGWYSYDKGTNRVYYSPSNRQSRITHDLLVRVK